MKHIQTCPQSRSVYVSVLSESDCNLFTVTRTQILIFIFILNWVYILWRSAFPLFFLERVDYSPVFRKKDFVVLPHFQHYLSVCFQSYLLGYVIVTIIQTTVVRKRRKENELDDPELLRSPQWLLYINISHPL